MKFFDRFKQKSGKTDKKASDAKPKLGLCLSGGGARGFAHIGAIKAFEEAGIEFALTVGASAGSIVGALYCAGVTADEMMLYGGNINMKEVHNGIVVTPNDAAKIARIVSGKIGNRKIEDFPKKFACVAVDLVEARQIILDSGVAAEAAAASSCVPLLFRPVVKGKLHLVDGGLLNNVPADVCRMLGADKVVTVDINPTRGGGTQELGLLGVLKGTFSIMSANSSLMGLKNSDVIIAPDMSRFSASSKDGWEDMIQTGYAEAQKYVHEILALQNA